MAGCGRNQERVDTTVAAAPPVGTSLKAAVSFFPLEDVVSRVGGERIEIVRLVAPGDNAHEAELSAKTVAALGDADAVFYVSGGFQPTVEKAVSALPDSVRAVDLFEVEGIEHIDASTSHDHEHDQSTSSTTGDEDPHVWLDPLHMGAMARAVAGVLAELDPAGSATYVANATAYVAEMDSLGGEMSGRLSGCATRTLVTAHDAFGYLARRAGLDTVSIAGLSPEDEPSARQLEAIADAARTAGVTTVFFEVSLPEDLARTVASAVGAGVDTLDALEGVTQESLDAGSTYSSIMRGNIDRIAVALGCP